MWRCHHSSNLMNCDTGPFLMKEWVESELLEARSELRPCFLIEKKSCKTKGIVSSPHAPTGGDRCCKKTLRQPPQRGLRGYPAQAQRPGEGGEASEPPHFLESSPVPRGPARRVLRGPGEPDNRRWLALKQSGNPLVSAGPPHRNQSLPPQARILDSGPGSACPTRIE